MSRSVTKWLEELGLGQFAQLFAEQQIDYETLPDLTEEDLEKLGIPLGPRKKLLKAVAALRGVEPESDAGADSHESIEGLAAWERHPGERKPVTMLFADITGSTALTERLDAEEAHELLYGATQRMCAAVEAHRGTVCRFMGDGVMAMFGAPVASEHHAIEACEAALAMQEAIREYATDGGGDLQIRVGLHSGEVVVLTVGEGDRLEYDASGPTVPIAARMEQSAEPGEVYLTAATHSLAGHRIETDILVPISVKGVSDPISVFALRRVRSVEESVLDGSRTSFVGRRAELSQFRGLLETCLDDGHGQTIYVRGEPGIGKTRLVEEFARVASERGLTTHRGLVLPFGVGKGQDAIRSLVRSLLGIPSGTGKDERLLAAEAALLKHRLRPDQIVFLNDLLDLPQPTEQKALYDAMENTTRNKGKQAVVSSLVSAVGSTKPLLAIVEDVHWADDITLAHLAEIAKTVADCPALLVMTSRIDGDQLNQSWRSTTDGSPFFSVDLGPLRKQESIALIEEFIDAREPLAQSCLERAAGNPLFLEQLLRNAQEITTGSLPDSIQSLVLARLDRLDPEDKRSLQAASVFGQRFDVIALGSLLGNDDCDVQELVNHNLLKPEGPGYLFAHALVQESVYASLLKSQRRDLHRRAAELFEHSDSVLHAQHLDQADDESAPDAYKTAIRQQIEQYHHERALELTERALQISPDTHKFSLNMLKGEVLRALGSVPDSIDAYKTAIGFATNDPERCHGWIGVAEGQRLSERPDDLLHSLDKAQSFSVVRTMPATLARVHQLRGSVHFIRSEIGACVKESYRSVEYARKSESPLVEAQSLSGLADAEYARARMITAYEHIDKCIELAEQHGLGRVLAANLPFRGHVLYYMGRLEDGLEDCRNALDLASSVSQLRAEMVTSAVASYIVADMGDPVEGKAWANRCLEAARRLDATLFVGIGLEYLARFLTQEGNHFEAESTIRDALGTLRQSESGMRFEGPRALGFLARVTTDEEERRAVLSEGLELLQSGLLSHNHLIFYRDAMEVSIARGEWIAVQTFADQLENYTRDQPLPWSDFFIARARVLANLESRDDDAQPIKQELERVRGEAQTRKLTVALPALDQASARLH